MRRPAGKHQTSEVTLEKHDNYNQKLTAILAELGQIEKSKGQMHRARAYEKAVRALRNHPTAITSGTEAQKLDGIGKKIGLKIDEILATGKLKKLDTLNEDPKTKALNLFQQLKHTFTHHQRIGLKHFHEFNERIPRAEMEQLEKIIKETLSEVDEELIGTTCGSYRRGAESSGDIDVLLTHPKYTVATKKKPEAQYLSRVVEALKRKGLITDDISQGSSKYMGVCKLPDDEDEAKEKKEKKKQDSEGEEEEEEVEVEAKKKKRLHRRIDLRVIPYENYYCGLLYFTGSDFFNQQMRKIALDRGFTLNEYDVCPVGSTGVKGDPIEVHSEEDIFELLGMTYKSPEQRNL
ncbi:DNA polymerase beta, putative [Acanthamoeba castellanii str. Neff]|uniref:DNA polymerase n=1 Tax=Acanthamoeba castellanii (strain ATCC 30010 / Neff) TaxID=1257118 RepID=L8GK72_ACACF|nr:DNA polymerase beta, putative [Acanthamoeba castellanii str. Neff]ELR13437.1 DNA polymerase beta, putative [Acanthamoeba castellanii str. Neff]